MASYLLDSDMRALGRRATTFAKKAAGDVIREQTAGKAKFNVFLSHARVDEELVLGVVEQLKLAGLTAYVDWMSDPNLDRSRVTRETANILRGRMRQCDMLFYLWSDNAQESRWMPWELGYFDAHRQKVAILPVVRSREQTFTGSEYLQLYPLVEFTASIGRPTFRIDGKDAKIWAGLTRTIEDVIRGL